MKRIVLFVTLLTIPALVLAQAQTTGRVVGTIVDEEGNPVAGARIVFISPALQGERVLTTSEAGRFLAAILPVGPYSAEISAPGMQPVVLSFRLGVGQTVPLDVAMNEGEEIVEQVTVYSTATALETTTLGENFSYDSTVEELPVQNRTIEKVAEYAPNITFGPTPNSIAISGAPSFDTTVLLDGAEVSDPYFGDSPILYLEDAIEEVQVLTAGVSARYGRFQGGVINAITKTGGNTFDGTVRAQFDNEDWNSRTPFKERQEDSVNEFYQGTFGGYILKDHLWFFGGLTEIPDRETSRSTIGTPGLVESFTTQREEDRWQLKLRGAVSPNHVIELNHLDFESVESNRAGLDAGNLLAANGLREDPREIDAATYQGVLTPNLFLDAQYTNKEVSILSGGDPDGFDPAFDFSTDSVFNNHWWDFSDEGPRDNETFGVNLTQALTTANWGSHTLEYGVQYVESTTGGENRQSATGFNLLAVPLDATAAPFWSARRADGLDVFNVLNYYSPTAGGLQVNYRWKALPLGGDQTLENLGVYVQETWEIGKWRFDAGLRWDDYEGSGPLPTFDLDFDEIAPRLGVTYNIDENWQVQATYGKYVSRFNDAVGNEITGISAAPRLEQIYVGPDCWADPSLNTAAVDPGLDGCDATDIARLLRDDSNWGTFTDVVDPQQPSTFNADDLEAPYANDINFAVKRALPRNSGTLTFTYTNREFKNLIDDHQGLVCDDFGFTYNGGQCSNTTDIFAPDSSLLATVDTIVWANTNRAVREYDALSVVADWRPSSRWGLGGNYTFGEIQGNYEGEGRNQPAIGTNVGDHERGYSDALANPFGFLDEDIRHRLRAWGSYRLSFQKAGALVLGSVLTYESGRRYDHEADVPRQAVAGYANQPTTFSGIFDGRGRFTFDNWWRMDLSARYQFPVWKDVNGWIKLDALNVTGEDTLTSFLTDGGADLSNGFARWTPSGNCGEGDAPSTSCTGFGRIQSEDDYQDPRTWLVTVGIRF